MHCSRPLVDPTPPFWGGCDKKRRSPFTSNAQNRQQPRVSKPLSKNPPTPGGGDPSVLDANYPPQLTVGRRPLGGGGGGAWEGGRMGGGSRRVGWGGGGPGGAIWGVGWGGAQAPLTSPCPPSIHTITINLTLTFAAS